MPFASSNPANKSIDKKLKEAVNQHDIELVKNLVEEGANPFVKNKDGKTAKMIAAEIESSTFGNSLDETPIYDYLNEAELKRSQERKYFFQLAKTNKWHEIEELVTKKPYLIYEQDNNGDTALHIAVKFNQEHSAESLLKYKANLNIKNKEGLTPAQVFPKNISAYLKSLIELNSAAHMIQKNIKNIRERKKAKITGRQEINELIIQSIDEDKNTYLHKAVIENDKDKILSLIKFSTRIDAVNINGYTALSLAVKLGNLEITRLLIANGANINTVDNNGNTLLHIAAINGHLELISELLNKGLIIDDKNHIGDTPLEAATRIKGNLEIVKALIEDKPILYKEYPNLNKIYNLAYQAEASLATKIGLVSAPMCKYIKQIKNETNNFIQLVAENKIEKIKEKIILKPYLIISNDKNNNTALHIAASKNYLEISEILVKYGIDIEAKNINYKTALDVAIESDRSWAGYFTNHTYNAATIMVNTSTYPLRNIANKVAERVNKIISSTNKSDLAKVDFTKNSYISTKETQSYLQSLTNQITAKSEIEGSKRLKNAQKEATIPSQDLKKLKANSSATNVNLANKQKNNKLSK